MGWDSNPRKGLTFGGFQDRCIKPLCHPSGVLQALARAAVHTIASRARVQVFSAACTIFSKKKEPVSQSLSAEPDKLEFGEPQASQIPIPHALA